MIASFYSGLFSYSYMSSTWLRSNFQLCYWLILLGRINMCLCICMTWLRVLYLTLISLTNIYSTIYRSQFHYLWLRSYWYNMTCIGLHLTHILAERKTSIYHMEHDSFLFTVKYRISIYLYEWGSACATLPSNSQCTFHCLHNIECICYAGSIMQYQLYYNSMKCSRVVNGFLM